MIKLSGHSAWHAHAAPHWLPANPPRTHAPAPWHAWPPPDLCARAVHSLPAMHSPHAARPRSHDPLHTDLPVQDAVQRPPDRRARTLHLSTRNPGQQVPAPNQEQCEQARTLIVSPRLRRWQCKAGHECVRRQQTREALAPVRCQANQPVFRRWKGAQLDRRTWRWFP